jgi:lipopolysaccharide export system ATP-binding protein
MAKKSESTNKGRKNNGAGNGHILTIEGLTKSFKARIVVDHINLEVRSGEIVGLLGPNGAGKTTSFYMIVGIVKPDAGRIVLDDEDIGELPMYERARRGITYLPQESSIFRKMTVAENIMAILETLPISRSEREERLVHLLSDLKISHLADNKATTLSGGERRRVEITRSLVTSPFFILLDEPFSGIDPIIVNDIQNIVLSLKKRGIGIIITDHNVRETLGICDRAYILNEGNILIHGTPRRIAGDRKAREKYLGEKFTM